MDKEQEFLNQLNDTSDNQEVEQVQEQVTPQPEEQVEEQPRQETFKESDKEKNMRILRERAERAERERDEYLRRMVETENYRQKQAPVQQEPEESDFNLDLDDDAIAEGKHVTALAAEMKKLRSELRNTKEELRNSKKESAQAIDESRLKVMYPDAESVVTKENLDRLKEMDPEAYDTVFNSNASFFSKAKTAYKMITSAGIAGQQEQQRREPVRTVAAKPRSIASVKSGKDMNPFDYAHGFSGTYSAEQDKALLKEMLEASSKI